MLEVVVVPQPNLLQLHLGPGPPAPCHEFVVLQQQGVCHNSQPLTARVCVGHLLCCVITNNTERSVFPSLRTLYCTTD
jgi:hypothetical protein